MNRAGSESIPESLHACTTQPTELQTQSFVCCFVVDYCVELCNIAGARIPHALL